MGGGGFLVCSCVVVGDLAPHDGARPWPYMALVSLPRSVAMLWGKSSEKAMASPVNEYLVPIGLHTHALCPLDYPLRAITLAIWTTSRRFVVDVASVMECRGMVELTAVGGRAVWWAEPSLPWRVAGLFLMLWC